MKGKPGFYEEINQLYLAYKSDLQCFVRATIKNESAVEDIVHEVYAEAVKKYEILQDHPNPVGWLYRTAGYKIKEYFRRLKQIEEISIEEDTVVGGTVEDDYAARELCRTLTEPLDPAETQRFRRYFLWGYTVEELARAEGVTVNYMRVMLSRLKKKVQEHRKRKEE